MTTRSFGYVALKVSGIYSLVTALFLLDGSLRVVAFTLSQEHQGGTLFLAYFIPAALLLIMGGGLLLAPERAARVLDIPVDGGDGPPAPETQDLMDAAFAVVGLVLLSGGLADVFSVPGHIANHLNTVDPETGRLYPFYLSFPLSRVYEFIIKIVLGLYLFLGGDGLIHLWRRIREKRTLID